MSRVRDQYEAYPYPARDPADEKRRLVTGSPSHPAEIDHFLFAGRRDWSQPFRVLVAGGGTGDGLVQLAQLMNTAGLACEIHYLDLSRAAREIAEARLRVRGISGVTFHTDSLLEAEALGRFDYIDCCGVLHHLPRPLDGFRALGRALAPGGGLGFMVYAPYGRSGVYPLQEAFDALFGTLSPEAKLAAAKSVLARVPAGHPFRLNPHLGDHRDSDAGLYDLLLHSQDIAFPVGPLLRTLEEAGLALTGFTQPALYDLDRLVDRDAQPADLSAADRMAVAEKLRGTIKVHVGYAVRTGEAEGRAADGRGADLVPHLKTGKPAETAAFVAKHGRLVVTTGGEKLDQPIAREAAPLIALIDGRRSLRDIATAARLDPILFGARWGAVHGALADWGLLLYSNWLRRK